MIATEFDYSSNDGQKISGIRWQPEDEAVNLKGIVQIFHGMAEHKQRYERLAGVLVKEGFIVYANDHRGHGKTAGAENLGHLADENGWNSTVEDLHELTEICKKEHPELPIYIIGHSMGSMLARDYIMRYSKEINGVILSGTSGPLGILGPIGSSIAKREASKKGKRALSQKLNDLSFGDFNKKFEPARTEFDWLSRDEKEVDKYVSDPNCGFICTAQFYHDLVVGTIKVNKKSNMSGIRKDLPVFIISGEKDPVGKNSKGVIKVYNLFKKNGMKDLKLKLYKEARHEIFNETNREEVFKDLIDWLKLHI